MRLQLGGLALDLTDEQVESLRRQLGVPNPGEGMVDAATLAKRLGVSREHVYAHAEELGGQKIGSGPKAPWRFDPAKLAPASPEQQVSTPKPLPPRRRKASKPGFLQVRGTVPGTAFGTVDSTMSKKARNSG